MSVCVFVFVCVCAYVIIYLINIWFIPLKLIPLSMNVESDKRSDICGVKNSVGDWKDGT